MMDFSVNSEELAALYGLPHAQQLTYLRGIRPYMDVKTGIVGIKRRISLQSISEEMYIAPHQGVKAEKYSRAQVRRALASLVRQGLITLQSEDLQLILKCNLATLGYSVQNKVVTNPSQKNCANTGLSTSDSQKADIADPQKAVTPLKENNYLYFLLQKFEQFWLLYPEKKSRDRAFETFQQINPDESLLRVMLQALDEQIKACRAKEARGEWVPNWKFPANWLAQKSWEDEVNIELTQENKNARRRPNIEKTAHDPFWNPETCDTESTDEDEYRESNVIHLQRYRQQ